MTQLGIEVDADVQSEPSRDGAGLVMPRLRS